MYGLMDFERIVWGKLSDRDVELLVLEDILRYLMANYAGDSGLRGSRIFASNEPLARFCSTARLRHFVATGN